MKTGHKSILWLWWVWQSISKVPKIASLQCLYNISKKKKVRDEVNFWYADKHQSWLQVDFNTLGIKFSSKAILSSLMGMINHSPSTQSKKFAISLQYLKKEVRSGLYHQRFYKLALSFLIEEARVPKRGSW